MTEDQAALEVSIDEAKAAISKADALQRLMSNKDFITVISDGYFKDEASELVLKKAVPALATDEAQASLLKAIDSIGFLRQYFIVTAHFGSMAKKSLEDDEATREELLSEEMGS